MKYTFLLILIFVSCSLFAQVSTTLDGSKSSDPDGTITAYQWRIISGPTSGGAITNPTVQKPTAVFTMAGTYSIGLVVTDNQGLKSSEDTVQIVVRPANVQPKADAGPDQILQLAFLNRNNGKLLENISLVAAIKL